MPVGQGLTTAMFASCGAMAGAVLAASVLPTGWDLRFPIAVGFLLGACAGSAVYWKVVRSNVEV